MNYYNEIDPFCCQWLENLMDDGLIPKGIIDGRSITQVEAKDLKGFTQCHFFAGLGGWPLALELAQWPRDRPVWTGSCPCQPFSVAGQQKGEKDRRHLWPDFHVLIFEAQPATIFGEQVSGKAGREWLSGVRTYLETCGYDIGAADLCAAGQGAPHIRQRLYWVAERMAHTQFLSRGTQPRNGPTTRNDKTGGLPYSHVPGPSQWSKQSTRDQFPPPERSGNPRFWDRYITVPCLDGTYRRIPIEPAFFPMADGVSGRVGRLRAYGNAIVPPLAAEFVRAYWQTRGERGLPRL